MTGRTKRDPMKRDPMNGSGGRAYDRARLCVRAAPATTITAPTGVDHASGSCRIATPAAVAITGMK